MTFVQEPFSLVAHSLHNTSVVVLVCMAFTTCHFETVQLLLCVSFSVGGGRDLGHRSYGASVPVILSILFLSH